jgi:hypothetical protein
MIQASPMQLTLESALAAHSSAALRDPNQQSGRVRRDDHSTSIAGADDIAKRAGGQKAILLSAFADAGSDGLNDEQAAERAGVNMRSCWWKRCGELRDLGLIQFLFDAQGNEITRVATSGVARKVSVITPLGRDTLQASNTP